MSIADIIISIITWIFQKLILPVLPTNMPLFSFADLQDILTGTLQHNLVYSFAGISQIFDVRLLFILLSTIIVGEILFWLVRAGLFIVKLVRG